ncbi:MAG: peptidoglycan-binding protein [Oscillospiraceae bacterium]|nr:peptidoglycan-binding protein [Oscillospiraceae bacterium]
MGVGYLRVQASAGGALPISDAEVTIKQRRADGVYSYKTHTDLDGKTEDVPMPGVSVNCTLTPGCKPPIYGFCDVDIAADGFVTMHIDGVEIVETQTAILPVNMFPLASEARPVTDVTIEIAPVSLEFCEGNCKFPPPIARASKEVFIPDYITVHLGRPLDTTAQNVRVPFIDYIKNVTSSEIYSTWPLESLKANVHAIVTFALNRIYTEWYPSRGYNFDITNSTSYDQYYRYGGPIYESIAQVVDEYFNVYAHRFGFRNPYFTQYCNGTTSTCPGMSQWGTVTLANRGLNALEILRSYYPRDLQLSVAETVRGITESFPGTPLTLGDESEKVRRMQNDLNRIKINYPLIPAIPNPNGYFGPETQNAVITFQRVFNLPADGVVDRTTWNAISRIFVAVSRLAELDGEGIRYTIGEAPPNIVLSQGSRGDAVMEMQFILQVVSMFYPSVPPVLIDGVFGSIDRNAVIAFQSTFGLSQTGTVNAATWDKLYAVYRGIRENAAAPVLK